MADVQSVSLTATRTTGMAPLPVFFDATGTVLGSGSLHHGSFFWTFGDPTSSHPSAVGFTAAHVFEQPGDYVVRLKVSDTTGPSVVKSIQIKVLPFTGTTYHVASSGSDLNDGKSASRPFKTFDHAMARLKADLTGAPAAVRVLFNRGDRFTTSTGVSFGHYKDGNPAIIGAYGTGPKPVIQNLGGDDDFTFHFGDCSGFRWVDIELVGTYDFNRDTGPNTTHAYFTDRARDFLMLRVTCHSSGQMFIVGTNNPFDKEEMFVVDCEANEFKEVGVHIAGKHIAVIGNRLTKSSFTHLLRVWYADRGVISENVLRDPSCNYPERGRHALKFHADTGGKAGKSRYAVVSDNEFKGCTWSVVIGPQDKASPEFLEHIIVERNLFRADDSTRRALLLIADDVTVRNNVFTVESTSRIDTVEHIALPQYPLIPGSRRIHIYNNTAVDLRADSNLVRFVEIEPTDVTGLEIKNNIFHAPNKVGEASTGIRYANGTVLKMLTAKHNLWYLPRTTDHAVARDASARRSHVLEDWKGLGQGQGSLDVDPKLVRPERGHYLLEGDSPAIDAGLSLPGVFESMNGVARPQGPATDLGAYEHVKRSGNASLEASPRSQFPGYGVKLNIDVPNGSGFVYQVALALNDFPAIRTPSGLVIPLHDDGLFRFSTGATYLPMFKNFVNCLDVRGQGQAEFAIPPIPALKGAAFFACALIWSTQSVRVTNPVSVFID